MYVYKMPRDAQTKRIIAAGRKCITLKRNVSPSHQEKKRRKQVKKKVSIPSVIALALCQPLPTTVYYRRAARENR